MNEIEELAGQTLEEHLRRDLHDVALPEWHTKDGIDAFIEHIKSTFRIFGYHKAKGKVELDPPPRFDKVYNENHPDHKSPENTNPQCAGKYSHFQCKLGGCSVYPSCTNPDKNKAPEPSEDLVEKVANKLNYPVSFEDEYGNSFIGEIKEHDRYKLARSILKLCQPELKVIKELRYFVANRGAGASTALESNAYSKVLEKIDELTHDQKQIKGE